MPFTLSHPAAVLSLHKRGLVFSALVVGSMSPDFEYLVHLQPRGHFSHSAQGLFLFSLPLGLLVLWLFHNIWKKPVILLLPDSLQARLLAYMRDFPFLPLTRFLIICLSLIIGVITHIIWDAFTHSYGWGVQKFPFLSYRFLNVYDYPVTQYKILQHGSTVIGIVLIFLCYIRWFKKADVAEINVKNPIPKSAGFWVMLFMILSSVVSGILYGIFKAGGFDSFHLFRRIAGFAVCFSFLVLIIEITILGVFMDKFRKLPDDIKYPRSR